MKITVFNGSPRGKRSNTHIMASALLEGAESAGAEVNNILLADEKLEYCRGCFTCWAKTPGECAINDNMKQLLALYTRSDIVGFATPLYSGNMTPLLKNFIDRLLPLVTPYIHENADQGFVHKLRASKAKDTKYIVISNSGFPGKDGFDNINMLFGYKKPIANIYRNCGETLTILADRHPQLKEKVEQYKSVLRDAGAELVSYNQITPDTMQRLKMDLLSDEEYMEYANKYWDSMLKGK